MKIGSKVYVVRNVGVAYVVDEAEVIGTDNNHPQGTILLKIYDDSGRVLARRPMPRSAIYLSRQAADHRRAGLAKKLTRRMPSAG